MNSLPRALKRAERAALVLFAASALASCGTLPQDVPSGKSFMRDAKQDKFALVDLTPAVVQTIAANPPPALVGLANSSSDAPPNLIAEGDQIAVSVFEPGSFGLFSQSTASAEQSGSTPSLGHTLPQSTPTSPDSQQTLPALTVDDDGDISMPFVGKIHVAGLRPDQAEAVIKAALRSRAVNPQVTVTDTQSKLNQVSVLGEVRLPGRFPIGMHGSRLLDVLAQAGGPAKAVPNLEVTLFRGNQTVEAPLSLVMSDANQNIRLSPEDRVLLVDRPRTYTTFGALLKDDSVDMDVYKVTLADALARGQGLDTYSANAAWVALFRFERPEVAKALGVTLPPAAQGVPIVYRINMREASSLFIANNLDIEPKDIVFVARSDLFEAKKFFDLVNSVTQIGYNARVTTSKNVP
jgi:polysaccharide biosynthesis/export protein